MATGTFQKNSLDWQIQQIQQQVGEWLELVFSRSGGEFDNADWTLPEWFLKGSFWLLVAALLGWTGWQLYRLLRPYLRQPASPPKASPVRSPSSATWIARSKTAQAQGDYREACRSLYMATLQHLNDRNLLPTEPSRTDGEYLTLTQSLSRSQAYQQLLTTHEQLCFSNASISAEAFDRCWQAYQEIERI